MKTLKAIGILCCLFWVGLWVVLQLLWDEIKQSWQKWAITRDELIEIWEELRGRKEPL